MWRFQDATAWRIGQPSSQSICRRRQCGMASYLLQSVDQKLDIGHAPDSVAKHVILPVVCQCDACDTRVQSGRSGGIMPFRFDILPWPKQRIIGTQSDALSSYQYKVFLLCALRCCSTSHGEIWRKRCQEKCGGQLQLRLSTWNDDEQGCWM